MEIYEAILGNIHQSEDWKQKIENADTEIIELDQWASQKSRLLAKGNKGNDYPIALKRGTQVTDGDVIYYDAQLNKAAIISIDLKPVLSIDLSGLKDKQPEDIIRITVELAHAIGNQHWPAVIKGFNLYVPLTVSEKVMQTVIDTHRIEGIECKFLKGSQVISLLSAQEARRLFGGTSHDIPGHSHSHAHDHCHTHEHDCSCQGGHHHHDSDDQCHTHGHDHCHDKDHSYHGS